MMTVVEIEKLVHGGQGLGQLPDGRKVFVWGVLPGEKAEIRIIKSKRSYAEAIVERVLTPSPHRVAPREAETYLSTSPWQIASLTAENTFKKDIVAELFTHAHVVLPDFGILATGSDWHYRNKMEYSFWGDDDGLHLALHARGSHRKIIVQGSELALPAIDKAARDIAEQLQARQIRAGDLKTIIVRANQAGTVVASLFVKPETFPNLELPASVQGLRVYHSNPKSPASVPTKLLYELGKQHMSDTLLDRKFIYDADSFFQVNLPVFETALTRIKAHCSEPYVTDMYAGVGSIGLSVANRGVSLVELDPATAAMARINAAASGLQTTVIETSTEKATEHITRDSPVIFDPPRAGLHGKVIQAVQAVLPPKIIYLSCNPATHARDTALLQDSYNIVHFEAFNFFPHTPHIETLAVLVLK